MKVYIPTTYIPTIYISIMIHIYMKVYIPIHVSEVGWWHAIGRLSALFSHADSWLSSRWTFVAAKAGEDGSKLFDTGFIFHTARALYTALYHIQETVEANLKHLLFLENCNELPPHIKRSNVSLLNMGCNVLQCVLFRKDSRISGIFQKFLRVFPEVYNKKHVISLSLAWSWPIFT